MYCESANNADSPFAAMAPSKKPLDTVSKGQLVSRGLMGGGGCSSCALGSTSGTYKTQYLLFMCGIDVFIHKHGLIVGTCAEPCI